MIYFMAFPLFVLNCNVCHCAFASHVKIYTNKPITKYSYFCYWLYFEHDWIGHFWTTGCKFVGNSLKCDNDNDMLKLTIYQWLCASFSLHVRYEVLIYTHRCVKIRIVMKTYNHWIECPRKLNVHPPCIMIVLTYFYDFLECNRYNHGYTRILVPARNTYIFLFLYSHCNSIRVGIDSWHPLICLILLL